MSALRLEDYVLSQIRNLVNNPTARERLIFDRNLSITENFESDYRHAAKMLSDIARRRDRVREAYEAGIDPLEVYSANLNRLNEEESKYREVAGDYEYKLQELNKRRDELEKFTKSLEDFDTLWANATFAEKKHFLRTLIKEIRAGNGKVEIDFRF